MTTLEAAPVVAETMPSRLHKVAHELWRVVSLQAMVPENAPDYMSEHFTNG